MKITYGSVVVSAGFAGILSFGFLALAIGTEYWYIIDDNRFNYTEDSHSGLWRTHEGETVYSFTADTGSYSDLENYLYSMHTVIAVLLPLSLVMLVFGGICGLVSSLARSSSLLLGTASYILISSLLTLSGVCLYISYSQQAWQETERRMGEEQMARVYTSFGWSLGMAWLSFILEVLTGLLLFLASRMVGPH
ncbi:transmembrane protein 235 [Clupea harengus]|uniref:Transmembrane protein 235 n=1 Tax=Clupea harengus TaxID=7950 RepID=A0A6P3W8V9_CLUHA|nr:transmembrane protein 235 [Clupea harengus]